MAATQLQCSAVSWCVCVLGLYSAGCVYTGEADSLKLAVRSQTDSKEGVISMQRTVSQLLPHSPNSRFPFPDSLLFQLSLFFGFVKVRSYQGTGPDLAAAVFQISNFRSTLLSSAIATVLIFHSVCLIPIHVTDKEMQFHNISYQ